MNTKLEGHECLNITNSALIETEGKKEEIFKIQKEINKVTSAKW